MILNIINFNNKNSKKKLRNFLDKRKSIQKNQTNIVSKIINSVKKNGDKAVLKYEIRFNKNKKLKTNFSDTIKNIKSLNPEVKKSIDFAFNRILSFHKNQKKINFF